MLILGPVAIGFLTHDPSVQETALTYLPYCALVPIVGFAVWELDGIFIGITRTKAMRNAGIISVVIYIGLHFILTPYFGSHGIWLAFLGYYIARGITLAVAYPGIIRDLQPQKAYETRPH